MRTDILWAMEPDALKAYLQLSADLGNGAMDQMPQAAMADTRYQKVSDILTISDDATEATIEIRGAMTPDGPDWIDNFLGFTVTGYKQIRGAVKEIMAMESIKTVTLKMNTPGGTVDGVSETFNALSNLAQSKKLIARNEGMIASGGYWLAMAAHEIVAIGPDVETGSIGVVVRAWDWTGFYEKNGIKQVVIVSKNAPEKDANISTEKGRDRILQRINAIERVFVDTVARGRNVSTETVVKDFGRGGVLIAQDPDRSNPDAISVGMIDRLIGTATKKQTKNINAEDEQPKQEVHKMTLQEFLNENAVAKSELQTMTQQAHDAGVKEEKERVQKRVDYAKQYLGSDYGIGVHNLAIEVITGETDAVALKAAVATIDSERESRAAAEAANATEELGPTPAEGPTAAAAAEKKETIETDADVEQAIKDARVASGLDEESEGPKE
jgi:ClpP class serine protease